VGSVQLTVLGTIAQTAYCQSKMIFGYVTRKTFRYAGALHALESHDLSTTLASVVGFDRC